MKIAFIYADKEFNNSLFNELKQRLAGHQVLTWESGKPAPAQDFEIILVMGKFTREQMEAQPRLMLIQTVSAGYDGIDVEAATNLGIWVSYSPSELTGNAISVAEFAVMLMLGASRYFGQVIQPLREQSANAPGITPALYNKTVCIVGLGTIGRMVAERLIPFGMHIRATDNHPKQIPEGVKIYKSEDLKIAVSDVDYVVLCIRATKKNENLIDEPALIAMKKGAMLINVARGSLVNEAALLKAVESGHIAAAGLDVVQNEPINSNNPLLKVSKIIVTPHVAGTTDITLKGTVDYISQAINSFADGKALKSIINKPDKPRHTLA